MPKKNADSLVNLEYKVANDPIFASLFMANPGEAVRLAEIPLREEEMESLPQTDKQDAGMGSELSELLKSRRKVSPSQTIQQAEGTDLFDLSPKHSASEAVMSVFVASGLLEHSVQEFSRRHFTGKIFELPYRNWWRLEARGDELRLDFSDQRPRILAKVRCQFSFEIDLADRKARAKNIEIPLTIEAQPIFAVDNSDQLYLSVKKGRIDLVGLFVPDSLKEDYGATISSILPFIPICTLPTVFDIASSDVLENPKTSLKLKSVEVNQMGVTVQFATKSPVKLAGGTGEKQQQSKAVKKGVTEINKVPVENLVEESISQPPTSEELESVFGIDNRLRLRHDSLTVPWRWVCWMNNDFTAFPSFTGFLVGARVILTVAHGVCNRYPKELIKWLQIIPGCVGKDPSGFLVAPHGYTKGSFILLPKEFYDKPVGPDFDFAFVVLPPQPLLTPDFGYFECEPLPDKKIVNKYPIISGYPLETPDKSVATQWAATGEKIRSAEGNIIDFTIDATKGQSGSPVFIENELRKDFPGGWYRDNPLNKVVGIFGFEQGGFVKRNGATRINKRIVDTVMSLRSNPEIQIPGFIRHDLLEPPRLAAKITDNTYVVK